MESHEDAQLIKRSKWRLVLTLVTFIALAILIYGVRKDIGGVIENLGKVNTLALLLIIPIEIINYDVYARFYRRLFKILDKRVGYGDMFRLNLELNFVNHILPSGGVSGISYFTVRMRAFGVSGPKSTLSQLIKLLLLYISFQPILIVGVLLLALRGHVNNLVMVVASSLITLLVVGTFAFIYMIESRSRINSFLTTATKVLNKILSLFRRKSETINIAGAQSAFGELHDNYQLLKENWRELKVPFLYMLVANATEVAAVYVVYIAFGRLVNVGAVILAYAVANFAGLVSVLPAGIGIYEGLMTAVLVATGIPAGLSIPVTIMYRVINMVIQLTPGYYFYQRAVRSGLDKVRG
ncbi:MAG TPA: lysylphosphatidylglycerol synthase transmembrane domain-containing protein [Candidatus Saccharimonadales bacterium]|nr:lysylphosphatidylglycerol synthase transmembrane domain-containing protein [Candidatus Saccharimonadales bacterium]